MPDEPSKATRKTSNREVLRRLSRRLPASPEITQILNGLLQYDDLSVAIIGTALLDAALERLIKTRFRYDNANLEGRIFNNRGPLSDFDSKIIVAQAFGIINFPMANEMNCLRVIRNSLAHSKFPLDFDNDLVSQELDTLKLPAAIAAKTEHDPQLKFTNKQSFIIATRFLLIIMDNIADHPTKTAAEVIAETHDAMNAHASSEGKSQKPSPAHSKN